VGKEYDLNINVSKTKLIVDTMTILYINNQPIERTRSGIAMKKLK